MESKKIQIYLAGSMTGLTYDEMNEWRKAIQLMLYNCAQYTGRRINVINPIDYFNFEEKRYQSDYEIMQFDLNKVRSSDVLVVNIKGINESIGTVVELYEAYRRDIPIIAYNPSGQIDFTTIHPWIRCCITRVETSMESIKNYIRDFYLR